MPPKKKAPAVSKLKNFNYNERHPNKLLYQDSLEDIQQLSEHSGDYNRDNVVKGITLDQNMLCYGLWDGKAYPVEKIEYLATQIQEKRAETLDFSGIAALTDVVFAIIVSQKNVSFDSVTKVVLDGCHLLTDAGITWMADAFPRISWLSMVGCHRVTENGLISLSRLCPKLKYVDISSTSANFLPKSWLKAAASMQIKATGCPLLCSADPAVSASEEPTNSKKKLLKVCILAREGLSYSVLSAIKGENQPSRISWPQVELDVAVDENLTAVVIEADTSLSKVLITSHTLVVIPSQIPDNTKLHEEAASVSALILEILGEFPQTCFLILGCKTDSTDISAHELKKLIEEEHLNKMTGFIEINYPLTRIEETSISKQLQYSSAWKLHKSLSSVKIRIDAADIDLNESEERNLLYELFESARQMHILKDAYCNMEIFQYTKTFHENCPQKLQSGIHTLNEAAQVISESSIFKESLMSFGAVKFLTNIGKLVMWKTREGTTFVANTQWLFGCLQIFQTPGKGCITNNGLNHTIADESTMWFVDKLKEMVENTNLDWTQLIMKGFSSLWLETSDCITTLSHLSENPVMSLDIFLNFDEKTDENGVHININYTLNQDITPSVLQEVIASSLRLHRPIHVWKTGVIIYDSIVAIMIGHTGNKRVLQLCAYMTSTSKDNTDIGESCAKLIYSTVEKYRIVVSSTLMTHGIVWEHSLTLSDSIKQPPDGVNGAVHSHKYSTKEVGLCMRCGITAAQSSMLTEMDMLLEPSFLTADHVKTQELNGEILGSLFKLTGPCVLSLSAQLDPMGCRQCSVLLIKGSVQSLKIAFISPEKNAIDINFVEKQIIRTEKGESQAYHISDYLGSQTLEGELITVKIKSDDPFEIEIYKGLQLMQTVPMPYSSYGLTVSMENAEAEGGSAVFTVHSSNFKARVVEVQEGMRLEAVDRLNPHLICVATVAKVNQETGKVLIHFDGWTERYDYWTEFEHTHLHPIGYMHYKGKELSASYGFRPELQIPHGYEAEFDWLTYLQEVGAEPVPYYCFNEKQTDRIPDDIIKNIESNLGNVFSLSEKEARPSCHHSQWRAEVLEHRAKHEIAKFEGDNQDYEKELTKMKYFVCLLPPDLSVQFLRFPSLDAVFSEMKQNLHFLCPGQVLDIHHVNHSGLPIIPQQPSDLKTWLKGLMTTYAYLIVQKRALPYFKSNFCAGSENIPESKDPYLDAALKRLYRLYLMHCIFYRTEPKEVIIELTDMIDKMLDTAVKSEDHSFTQQFSISSSSTVLCHGHKLAKSPSSNLMEITIDKFQSLAPNIYVIHLENNPLTALPADFFNRFVNLTHLVLDDCKITELPALHKNICLEEIHMRGNALTGLPQDIKQLASLRILDISNNPLGVLPSVISSLESLVELYAENVGVVNLAIICPLKNLTKLYVGQNYIEAVPDEISSLELTVFDMSGLPLLAAGSVFSMHTLNKHLDQFFVYSKITTKERQQIIESVESLGMHRSNTEKISDLNMILLEKFPRLGKLESQKDASIPEAILNMTSLDRLIIPYHAFKTVPDSIENLSDLLYLSVDHNPYLETVSAKLATLPITELHLKNCPNLKTPPREVVQRGYLAVFGYLKRLLQGSVSCKKTKLMMVGLGGAGKTSLVNSLTNDHHLYYQDYGEKITDGINITHWVVPVDKPAESGNGEDTEDLLHFSVWDFAGQTVYYNTHQFFLSNRAVYLLLWNIRLGFEHAGLDFWLSSIACHAPKAPIFIVGSHCDKVQKGKLPREELKRRFPQIVGFHFVSSYTGDGIPDLKQDIIQVALSQKYMGEMIPEAWLAVDLGLERVRAVDEKSLLSWTEMEEVAGEAGIFDGVELVQAVQFLHDLGSVQFFNTSFLRSYVVIIPQWIIDVMACIVTVHDGPTKDGRLIHSDIKEIWQNYPEELHPWLLRLTEEFDLTFPLSSEKANIVPCLLPTTEPKFDFPAVDKENDESESRMMYRFEYLPAGLFNRAQVRLHQFSDSSVMWKKGVLLKKNNHRALLHQISNTEVMVTARGYKPENIIFLVHEVFECLISDSYGGVSYDYSIPCLDCVTEFVLDPSMFSASKIKRASDMKVPFLQCDKHFHIVSIPEIQAIMPPDNNTDFDEHLGRSVRELQDLRTDVGVRVLFIYTRQDVPDLANVGKVVNPTQVLEDMKYAGCNVSYCDNPEKADMESMTVSIKAAQVVIFGVSDQFVADAQCRNLIIYTKQTLHKTIILLTFGKTFNWQKTDINLILADEVFVNMTQLTRYDSKLPELLDTIKTRSQKKKVTYPECFISYSWANSKTAVDLGSASVDGAVGWGDPRKIKEFLQAKGINCWIDIEQMGQEGFFEDIADGLRKAKVMIACVSDQYANSKNCKMEFRFAVSTLKIPTILAVVGTGYMWERSEIGLLTVGHSLFCPKINLQYKNESGLIELLKEVQGFLLQSSAVGDPSAESVNSTSKQTEAFQEVLELAQRKMLRHIVLYSGSMDIESYPRLVLVDLRSDNGDNVKVKAEKSSGGLESYSRSVMVDLRSDNGDNVNVKAERSSGELESQLASEDNEKQDPHPDIQPVEGRSKSKKHCFRLLCEHEQGWHESPEIISFPDMDATSSEEFLKNVSPYLVRVLAVLKYSKIDLPVLNSPEGEQFCKKLEEWCPKTTPDFQNQYKMMVQTVLEEDERRTYGGLKRCQMPNGKVLWLCEKHEKSSCSVTEEKYKNHINQEHEIKAAATDDENKVADDIEHGKATT